MLYIVYEIYCDLIPHLTAFSSKKEMHLYLHKCELYQQNSSNYSCGELKIPYSRTKKNLIANITWATGGGKVDYE